MLPEGRAGTDADPYSDPLYFMIRIRIKVLRSGSGPDVDLDCITGMNHSLLKTMPLISYIHIVRSACKLRARRTGYKSVFFYTT